MKTTSHFIGIPLKSEIFGDLFVSLYEYLDSNGLADIITFQNPLSMHVTLYYFGADIDAALKKKIGERLGSIFLSEPIYAKGFEYFYRDNEEYVGYLGVSTLDELVVINKKFHKEFQQETVFENSLDFKAHITLFRVQDREKFLFHKEALEGIIFCFLDKAKSKDISSHRLSFYGVNSHFREEIQIEF